MKKVFLILISLALLGVLVFVYKIQSTNSLSAELEKTVDDGGKADFDSLTQDALGL